MKNLHVKVSKRTSNGAESWEGTVSLPGLLPTKVAKTNTTDSKFTTRSALTSAAQRLAARYGFDDVEFEGGEQKKPATKKSSSKKRVESSSLALNSTF